MIAEMETSDWIYSSCEPGGRVERRVSCSFPHNHPAPSAQLEGSSDIQGKWLAEHVTGWS
jgi:hypothetical protein